MKNFNSNVKIALKNAFNSPLVQKLSPDEYAMFIESCCALTLSTIIKEEGHEFARDFCQGNLDEKNELVVLQQSKMN
jgi:hypothetical protein